MQSVNRRRVFGFDVSVLVLIKHTKNLDIIYTSSVLSFLPRSFVLGNYTSDSEVYCNWWFTDSYENVDYNALQICPCTMESVRFDPDYIYDSASSLIRQKHYENFGAIRCYLKYLNIT